MKKQFNNLSNLLIVNVTDNKAAGMIAYQLNRRIGETSINSKLLTLFPVENEPNVIPYWSSKNPNKRLSKFLNRIKLVFKGVLNPIITNPDFYFYDKYDFVTKFRTKSIIRKLEFKPDAILILFNQGFLNAKNIYEISTYYNAPVHLLMMDMAQLTGGCHYAWDCIGYENYCGNCPGLYSDLPHDLSYKNLLFKINYFSRTNITLIAASEWQYRQAKKSTLFKSKPIQKILLGFDADTFKPSLNKELLKVELKLPSDKKIIFFGAMGLKEKRKGISILIDALNIIKKTASQDIHLLIAGANDNTLLSSLPFDATSIGVVGNNDMIRVYQAADIFVCSSIEDSGPSMINQALLCGLPVVSFEMGVALDLVFNGQTGYRAKLGDSMDLAKGIIRLIALNKEEKKSMSQNCRTLALAKCSLDTQTASIINLIGLVNRN